MDVPFKPGCYPADIVKTHIDRRDAPIVLVWFKIHDVDEIVRYRINLTPGNVIARNKLSSFLVVGKSPTTDWRSVDEAVLDAMVGTRLRVIVKIWRAPDGRNMPVVDFVRAFDDVRTRGPRRRRGLKPPPPPPSIEYWKPS